jgi:hypothetical protein
MHTRLKTCNGGALNTPGSFKAVSKRIRFSGGYRCRSQQPSGLRRLLPPKHLDPWSKYNSGHGCTSAFFCVCVGLCKEPVSVPGLWINGWPSTALTCNAIQDETSISDRARVALITNRMLPNTVAARSKAWHVFVPSNTGIVGSNPTRGMYVCVCSVFVLSYVGSGLLMDWSPAQGTLQSLYEIQISQLVNTEWAQAKEPNPSRQKKKQNNHRSIYLSTAFIRHWPFIQFLNPIHSRQDSLDGGSACRKGAKYTENINTE